MNDYKTPGVYVEEISTLPASVAPVATAIPAFVGYTEGITGRPTDPVRITSMVEYVANFGGPDSSNSITISGDPAVATLTTNDTYILYYCLQHYFANGGGPCWVVSAGAYVGTPAVTATALTTALAKVALEDEPTLLVVPESISTTVANFGSVVTAMLGQCNDLQDRFAIIDTQVGGSTFNETTFRNDVGTNYLKYGAVYHPHLITSITLPDSAVTIGGVTIQALKDSDDPSYTSNAAIINAAIAESPIELPPSSAMAGVYASIDRTRGVWKAPANVSLNAVKAPKVNFTNLEQEDFNVHTTGKSINLIRSFSGKGTLVWGARTLAGNDNEWRYVPVRRLFINAEESIKKATEFVVFEPNDANTWTRTKVMIENYLTGLWKDGALAGAVPEDAFFVNVGLGTTMTSQDILEGRLIIEIGMAAVRPAEFIILRFMHKVQE